MEIAHEPTSHFRISDLTVAFGEGESRKVVVSGVDLLLRRGTITGLAGESGSGKSTTALASIGFPIRGGLRLRGSAHLGTEDLLQLLPHDLERAWGRRVAFLGQNNGTLLDPLRTIGFQLMEPLRLQAGMGKAEARTRAKRSLMAVSLPDPEGALKRYPHQFSGGQQQRIALALALSGRPEVLILDEPTTGLDVGTQQGINELIVSLVRDSGCATLYISHDLAMLATVCDDVAIMYGGEIVEHTSSSELFRRPRHPYTAALIDAVPRIIDRRLVAGIGGRPPAEFLQDCCGFVDRCRYSIEECSATHPELIETSDGHLVRCIRVEEIGVPPSGRTHLNKLALTSVDRPILDVAGLSCSFGEGPRARTVVKDISFELAPGEALAIVGESGSGKSTLLRALVGLHRPSDGRVTFDGERLAPRIADRPRDVRRSIQLVFQNPDTSLNPRHTVQQILQRPIALLRPDANRKDQREIAIAALHDVSLESTLLRRRPHELSGGQRQRVALARAFALEPAVVLCDEVVSALDVSVAAVILELLATLAAQRGTGLVFVTHNLAVVSGFADRIAVMKDGCFVETGASDVVLASPENEYTQRLLAAVPDPGSSHGLDSLRGG